jgi:hypothetical protein
MTRNWFADFGLLHRPRTWQGWLVTLAALAFCVQVFLAVDRRSHSVSDTLYGIFPYVVPVFLLVEWLASRTTARP